MSSLDAATFIGRDGNTYGYLVGGKVVLITFAPESSPTVPAFRVVHYSVVVPSLFEGSVSLRATSYTIESLERHNFASAFAVVVAKLI